MPICAHRLLFVGPGKTGTSWIDHVLRGVDGVRLPTKVKETFFFDRNYRRGTGWYYDQFQAPDGDNVAEETARDFRIEVGPTYFFSDDVPARVRDTLPDARVVVTLRDPVQRAISHYLSLRKYGHTDLAMDEALYAFPSIAEHSLYAERLDLWRRVFGDVQVIFYEDVVGQVGKLFHEARLGAAPLSAPAPGRVNGASVPRSRRAGRLHHRGRAC